MSLLSGRKGSASVVVLVGVLCAAMGYAAGSANSSMSVMPFESAKFTLVDSARPDGPSWSVLWGNPDAGPSATYLKLKKGSNPLHLHTADYHAVMIQGTMKHWDRETPEIKAPTLGPGSYFFQPGGKAHAGTCLTDECIMFVHFEGKRDGMMAPAEKEPSI